MPPRMTGVKFDGPLVFAFNCRLVLRNEVEIERAIVMGIIVCRIQLYRLTEDLCRFTVSRLSRETPPPKMKLFDEKRLRQCYQMIIPQLGRVEECLGGIGKRFVATKVVI